MANTTAVVGNQVSLPKIISPSKKVGPVRVIRELRSASTNVVTKVDRQKVSGRWEQVLTLDSEERIIITARKTLALPSNVEGALSVADGERKWIEHRVQKRHTEIFNDEKRSQARDEIIRSWRNKLTYKQEIRHEEEVIQEGLRPPQLGALHAIGSHWSIYDSLATVVMPTGTGKTETMLAAMVALTRGPVLVVVPSRALRTQTLNKFLSLGLLRKLGIIPQCLANPIVGLIEKRPNSLEDLNALAFCNVVVTTVHMVAQGMPEDVAKSFAQFFDYLIIDEAHHVPADTWQDFKDRFQGKRILQFTATPFRADGKTVDGKVIFNYPLAKAQQDGYFRRIEFLPLLEIDAEDADEAIAQKAVERLNEDLENELDHILMARCNTIDRANAVFDIYRRCGNAHNPILVTSDSSEPGIQLEKLKSRQSRIVVCVAMLGEGFDLPNLKIAAVHDPHKSLAILLQFTGRFTRTASRVGNAAIVANIANSSFSAALERLYSEDADWNSLLSEFSSEAIKQHLELIEFLQSCKRLDDDDENDHRTAVSPKVIRPKMSTAVYECDAFFPKQFHHGLDDELVVESAWIGDHDSTIFFITRVEPTVEWSRSKHLTDRVWDIYIIHYNYDLKLLFIHSSDKSSLHPSLAAAVTNGKAKLIMGDTAFRVLGKISRLVFQNIGIKKHGRRNLRYSMYTGADVATALSPAQTSNSTKSNMTGSGYENGSLTNIGCSYKGRIWKKDQGTIKDFINWCRDVGTKLRDSSISTEGILENVMIPKEVTELPQKTILSIDWPREFTNQQESRLKFRTDSTDLNLSEYSIEILRDGIDLQSFKFRVECEAHQVEYKFALDASTGYSISHISGPKIHLQIGKFNKAIEEWFLEYPPSVLYIDGSELDGCLLYEPHEQGRQLLAGAKVESWDWTGIDKKKESQWVKEGIRKNSVQYRAIEIFRSQGFDVIFDDDGAGEAADIVAMRESETEIKIVLAHCKFSGGSEAGQRVKDAIEVCAQAVKSIKWLWDFGRLHNHLLTRNSRSQKSQGRNRFIVGSQLNLARLLRAAKFKPIVGEIFIVQPGISIAELTADQETVLASAHSYLLETAAIPLNVRCSE